MRPNTIGGARERLAGCGRAGMRPGAWMATGVGAVGRRALGRSVGGPGTGTRRYRRFARDDSERDPGGPRERGLARVNQPA